MINYTLKLERGRCKETTREVSKDEIYFVAIPIVGKLKNINVGDKLTAEDIFENAKILKGIVTNTETKVKSGKNWIPTDNTVSISVEDDSFLTVLLIAYEEDDGKLKEQIKKEITIDSKEITIADNPNYKGVFDDLVEELKKYKDMKIKDAIELVTGSVSSILFKIVVPSVKILKKLYTEMKSDDLIDTELISYDFNEGNTCFLTREFTLKGKGAVYQVSVRLEK